MASMLRDVNQNGAVAVNVDALKSEIRRVLITKKANACPITMRLAWHSSGTFDKKDNTGGSNGATMRFEPESTDPDNAGLSIIRDLLQPVKLSFPELSWADLYTAAGCYAIEFLGGPKIPFNFGRAEDSDGRRCPANGRLPDGAKGADHLRQVFGRMGFNDREIVALSGGHTLGRCHRVRSGFDGPWTTKPLQFDNEYYTNLLKLTWKPRKWNGPPQFEDAETGKLMMLASDLALIEDAKFRVYTEMYAKDEKLFFKDFAEAFGKLLALGCPPQCDPSRPPAVESEANKASAEFRELCMHGSVAPIRQLVAKGNVNFNQLEATSGRSALHKAAFWGHTEVVNYLLELNVNTNIQDHSGDTALHDAAKFGHIEVVQAILEAGADTTLKNNSGMDVLAVATLYKKENVVKALQAHRRSKL